MKYIALVCISSVLVALHVATLTKVNNLQNTIQSVQEEIGTTICLSSVPEDVADNSLNEN